VQYVPQPGHFNVERFLFDLFSTTFPHCEQYTNEPLKTFEAARLQNGQIIFSCFVNYYISTKNNFYPMFQIESRHH